MDPAALKVLHWVLEARQAGEAETVSLPGADLRGATLMRADLVGAELTGAGLDHADLAGAKLGHAQLQSALLRSTKLDGADLTGADLSEADLSGASLEGAVLAECNLCGASIEAVVGEPASIAGAKIDVSFAERSGLADDEVIQLWGAGAVIVNLDKFSKLVRRACSAQGPDLPSDAGPPTRKITHIEREARRNRLSEDHVVPPTARLKPELERMKATPAKSELNDVPPLSTRSLKLVAGILTPEIIAAPGWSKGDEVLGVTLQKRIGSGNVAHVWRGKTADGELVAVKMFDAQKASKGLALPAFRRGVQIMNRLTARADELPASIVRLRCVSLNKLGFVTDLAANGSVVDLPALKWRVKSIVKFFTTVCEGIAAAHSAGVLHRCLKPSNILLDDDLDPILTDFDLVDLPSLAAASADAGGYKAYAAPEEILALGTQSPTADIYSLGRILQFLLLGTHPDDPVAEVPKLEALKNEPAGLTRIIRKCTMRAPELRYQWVSELLKDLDRYERYEQVGVAGEEYEANYLPYRVSALLNRTPWFKGKGGRRRALRGSQRPKAAKAPGSTRKTDKWIGLVGCLVVLAAVVIVVIGKASDENIAEGVRAATALGAGATTFLLPAPRRRVELWRVAWALAAAVLAYTLNLPQLLG